MWHAPLFTIHETPVTALSLLTFIGIIILTWVVAKCLRKGVMHFPFLKGNVSGATLYGLGRFAYYLALSIGSYIALTVVGVDLTGIAVVIGALSVGIGFGLQSVFNNFAAGIILLIEKKVSVGDMIQLESGEIGHVKEINVRSTLIQSLDNRKILVPNIEIVSKKLTNWTLGHEKFHRFRIPFTVLRKESKEKVKALALEVAEEFNAKKTVPEVWLSQISEKYQEFELVLWMEREEKGLSAHSMTAHLLWSLDTVFTKEGIELIKANRCVGSSPFLEEL